MQLRTMPSIKHNLRLRRSYMPTYETDRNSTFYACADITYVPFASFTTNMLCFNVSEPTTTSMSSSTSTATSSPKSSSSGLSGSQIAGIVVGCVAGAALAAVTLFVLWTRHQRRVQGIRLLLFGWVIGEIRVRRLRFECRLCRLCRRDGGSYMLWYMTRL